MANKPKAISVERLKKIAPGTPEMEAYLAAGYPGMTVKKAKAIIEERKQNPALWPYSELEKAEAFLAAYDAKPIAIDKSPHWEAENKSEDET